MKHVKRLIKLTNRNTESLSDKEQRLIIGGHCVCGCFYAGCGGSSSDDNEEANWEGNKHSQVPMHHDWEQLPE
jgi:natural product precursor